MIAMIFEFWFDPDAPDLYGEYRREAARLHELVPAIDGFEDIERFESVTEAGKFVAVGVLPRRGRRDRVAQHP